MINGWCMSRHRHSFRIALAAALLCVVAPATAQVGHMFAAWAPQCVPSLGNLTAWNASTDLPAARYRHASSVLLDGRVFIGGGFNSGAAHQATTWLGTVSGTTISWDASTALPATRSNVAASVLPDGRILIPGGFNGSYQTTVWLGTVSGTTISWTTSTALPAVRALTTVNILPDGRALIIAGSNGSTIATTLLGTVSGTTISWVTSNALPAARALHTASILLDGRVLVTGGWDGSFATQANTWLGTVSGTTISWAASTALPAARYAHTASVLSDGRILVTGGFNGSAQTTTWLGTVSGTTISWAASTALPAGRNSHSASVLPGGQVLLTAGEVMATTLLSSWSGGC